MKEKIILVGYHGTGLNTTVKALEILGAKIWDKPLELKSGLLKKSFKKLESKFSAFNVFAGIPFTNHYQDFKDLYGKDCKVILNVRDPEEWYSELSSASKSKNGYIFDYVFSGIESTKKNHKKKKTIQKYMDHNMAVMDYFAEKDEDILILEFGKHNKWKRLCEFLNIDVPDAKFPKRKDDFKKSIFSLKSSMLF